ncbi:MAG: hypothetical protein AVDCRST_MAG14-153 [uncultured Rubrobacteraceae bacterium]|uniref:Uncharacterized protein n=1 Tax=uncultured Rubrobacteraceae bacterium TaxID=349277 RepID=A0A6J4QGG1_9ACTN|nr:MAG: hypothetical protein AVDCRST_MAG14-153 [uncultured Rubrobacteraceae bacterium]
MYEFYSSGTVVYIVPLDGALGKEVDKEKPNRGDTVPDQILQFRATLFI